MNEYTYRLTDGRMNGGKDDMRGQDPSWTRLPMMRMIGQRVSRKINWDGPGGDHARIAPTGSGRSPRQIRHCQRGMLRAEATVWRAQSTHLSPARAREPSDDFAPITLVQLFKNYISIC